MSWYDYYQPETLEKALSLKKTIPDSFYMSGGTDLMVRIKKRELRPRALISLRSIPHLSGVKNGKIIRIGAMTSISELLKITLLYEKYPVLLQAAKELGSVQIRNMATIGGNLCNGSPAADMALPLLILEAEIRLQGVQKSRDLPLEKFFQGPGETNLSSEEILTDILLGLPEQDTKAIFLKKGRMKMDLAVASLAVLIRKQGDRCLKVRIAAGSVAPTPLRLFDVEALLEGATLSRELLTEAQHLASKSISPITDIRSTADYRCHLVEVLLKRAFEKLMDRKFEDRNGT
jgi:CO/xanthine dehydrogenase FAD-binding subunit